MELMKETVLIFRDSQSSLSPKWQIIKLFYIAVV